MSRSCARSWEVEAVRDERLVGDARASSLAHRASCASCAKDAGYIESLASRLQAVEVREPDELAMRRLRQRVLQGVDADQVQRSRSRFPGRAMIAAAAAVALVVAGFSLAGRRDGVRSAVGSDRPAPAVVGNAPAPALALGPATKLEIVSLDTTQFVHTTEGDIERIDLAEGTLQLRVERGEGGRRVVVRTPDGEIEDVGTVFLVAVKGGHTERVAVERGRVLVRLGDSPMLTVGAGESWERHAEKPRAVVAAPSVPIHAAAAPKNAAPPGEVEDVAYLRVVQLRREHRDAEARLAAAAYLRDFPEGFRRAEMARVAQP